MSKKLLCLAVVGLAFVAATTVSAETPGKVLFEYYMNIGSGTAVSNLTSAASFPGGADRVELLDAFEDTVVSGTADNYGAMALAYLIPPKDGSYTFWIASDDASELWLSTDDTAANAVKIAGVSGWAGSREYTREAGQKSAAVTLKGGQRYYMKALMKEGSGGDNLSVAWTVPDANAPVVIPGSVCVAPDPRLTAINPTPANGAVEVTQPLLKFKPALNAAQDKIYIGTKPDMSDAALVGTFPVTVVQVPYAKGFTPGTVYYWRVDGVDKNAVTTQGDVWSFTAAPLAAHNPTPPDGMAGRILTVQLKWTIGNGAINHKVFVSTDQAAVAAGADSAVATTTKDAFFSPAGLVAKTTYYWRVDELDATGKLLAAGPVWSFATIDPAGGAMAEYWNDANLMFFNLDLVGAPKVVKKVDNIDLPWPSGSAKGTNSPDPNINTDYFFGRYTALLNVPVSGQYTLIESSDDGGMLYLDGVAVAGRWTTGGETEYASTPLDLVAGQRYVLTYEYFESTGGAAARVRWSGPGISKQAIWQGALMPPDCAFGPVPRNGAAEVTDKAVMIWQVPAADVKSTVYFGTDQAKVTAGDATLAVVTDGTATTYVPASLLKANTTYYWRVDVKGADKKVVAGQVWSFTTANFVVVQPAQIALPYDTSKEPYMSQLAFDVTGDLTRNGVTDLALRFQGVRAPNGGVVYTDANGVYKVTGGGTDVWGTSDQFEYAYQTLTGDGSMVARIASIGPGANTWAKGGVMIRQSLDGNAQYAATSITPDSTGNGGNGGCFQWRATTGGSAAGAANPTPAVGAPYWVKIERKGNTFQGFLSADGKTWNSLLNSDGTPCIQTIAMTDPVYIGLQITSHVDAFTTRTFTVDNVSTTGNVSAGKFTTSKSVGITANSTNTLYVAIEDQAGKMAVVNNANPAAVNTTVYDLWRVPMSAFTGVDLKKAKTLYVGVGSGQPDGWGTMQFADIRIVKPVTLPAAGAADVTVKGDPLNGFPNYSGAWPAAEVPANCIDDTTGKYLNFSNSGGTGGATTMPCGFTVTPSMGATVVTGLTFTAANDSPDRDPINWELYGSNATIDGPWAIIAKGTVDDFSRGSRDRLGTNLDWPRNWKTVTPIGFANTMSYTNYKVQFTSVKRPVVANSMQIAEVELLGVKAAAGPVVVYVSFSGSDGPTTAQAAIGFTKAADIGYTDLLKANGYNVVRYVQNNNPNVDMLNQAALVIASRNDASASFQNAAADLWNSVSAPMIVTNGYLSRKSRLGYNTGSTGPQDITGDIKLAVSDANHPIFKGIKLTNGVMDNVYAGLATYPTDGTKAAGISIVTDPANADGKTLATLSAASGNATAGSMVIAEWQIGGKLIHDGGNGTNVLTGRRLVFLTGSRENNSKTSETAGMFDLSPDGTQMFLNAVAYMLQK